ncbi:MAG: hypothetical protein AAFR71_09870 [Pseudomonadota bacterium]
MRVWLGTLKNLKPPALMLCCAFICGGNFGAIAADFAVLTDVPRSQTTGEEQPPECQISLSGTIQSGDHASFLQTLTEYWTKVEKFPSEGGFPDIVVFCLDSPGGSVVEALKIAEEIRRRKDFIFDGVSFIETRLAAGSSCLSACALIFLSGTFNGFEDSPIPYRSMHPTARLGIHAPSLALPNEAGQFPSSAIQEAYAASIETIAETLRVLHLGEDSGGVSYGGEEEWIRGSLVTRMLQTAPEGMYYVDSIDDVGRWGITVSPLPRLQIDPQTAATACYNYISWSEGRSVSDTVRSVRQSGINFGLADETTYNFATYAAGTSTAYEVLVHEYHGYRCIVGTRFGAPVIRYEGTEVTESDLLNIHFYEGSRKLKDIGVE